MTRHVVGSYERIIELVIALAQADMRMIVNLAESSRRHSGARFFMSLVAATATTARL